MQSNNNVPRPARHLKEKYRREQMKRLYRRLASLVSPENSLKTSPTFDVLDQATKYIKQLENNVNDLKARKDFLQQPIEIDVNESETGESLEINIVCGPENKKLKMHKIFQILKEEGAEVVSATNNTVDFKMYHTILCKSKQQKPPTIVQPCPSNYEPLQHTIHNNSCNFQSVAINNADPSRIIPSTKSSGEASTKKSYLNSSTTLISGNCFSCGELDIHCSDEGRVRMSSNIIKEYVEDDGERDVYDVMEVKVVEEVRDHVNSGMQQRHLLYAEEKSFNQHNIFRTCGIMFEKVCKLTMDDGNWYNINSKVLDGHLGLEIETQPKLYTMEVDKRYEGIVRWVVIDPGVYPKQSMSAHEFYWHQVDSRNLKVEAFTENVMTHREIKVKKTSPAFDVLDQATKYIKQLENNVNDLKARKDFLQLPIEIDVNESETGETLEINIVCGHENKKLKMHKIFQILKEEGAEVVSATNNTVDLKMYHTILCKV
nr:transcription factor bHLH167-like [Ipomoea batatas]